METNDKKYCYRYFHPAVTADCVIFGFDGKGLKILLVERGNEPYLGMWALPGGFMKEGESIEQTARRELQEETNLREVMMEQFRVFSAPGRDPREQVVTVVFIALVRPSDYKVIAGDDAAMARWFDASMLPPLAFDHAKIVREAREHLKEMLRVRPVAFGLLDKAFSMSELQTLYEAVNGVSYDRRNFMRTAVDSPWISEAKAPAAAGASRAQKLYEATEPAAEQPMACAMAAKRTLRNPPDMACEPEAAESDCSEAKPRRSAPTKGLFDFLRPKKN